MIQVQPAEGIQLHFYTKVPDGGMRCGRPTSASVSGRPFTAMPEAYERLLLDVMHGDASLFSRTTKWNWPGA